MIRKPFNWSVTGMLALTTALTGCAPAPPAEPTRIGVIGPMEFIHGRHHWYGATMAAEEINEAGGVTLENRRRTIELVKADSNGRLG